MLNIAHLELYKKADEIDTLRPTLPSLRKTFEDLEEFEVAQIVDSRYVKGPNGRKIQKYKVRWKGYEPKYDTWETRQNLRNVPEALRTYKMAQHDPLGNSSASRCRAAM